VTVEVKVSHTRDHVLGSGADPWDQATSLQPACAALDQQPDGRSLRQHRGHLRSIEYCYLTHTAERATAKQKQTDCQSPLHNDALAGMSDSNTTLSTKEHKSYADSPMYEVLKHKSMSKSCK
jgi:hypothetical protein